MIKTHSGLQLSPSYADAHTQCLGTPCFTLTPSRLTVLLLINSSVTLTLSLKTKLFGFKLSDLFRVDMHAGSRHRNSQRESITIPGTQLKTL